MRKQWIDFESTAAKRSEIARAAAKMLASDFSGEILEVRPYIGGGKSPESLVHTTVEFQFVGVEQNMNAFVSALQRELTPHNITLQEWSDDGDIPWSFWSWIKSVFRDITLQHR